jgi:outer membrane murein-binding lipoprotein Lpp
MEEEIERNRTVLQLLYADIRMAERRVKGLTTMVEKLESSKADLNTEIEKLQEELKAGEGDAAAIQSKIDMRKAELESVERKCTDKMEKLSAAEQLLESLNAEMDAIKQRTEHLRDEGYKAADNIHQQIELQLSNALLHEVLGDFRMRLPSLSMYDRSMFEDSMLMDMAEKGDAVMNCAVLLFAGYIDQATQFAQGHGGGGGTTSGWGRDPDEDERAWALKCMQQACRMMRPSTSRASRRR